MRRILPVLASGLATMLSSTVFAADSAKRYEVRFPPELVRSSEKLAIDHVSIVIACGEFVAIERVPSDWNVGISRPISGQSGFDASAGHGASALPDLSSFDGTIVVGRAEPECLGVSRATASSMQGEWEREIVGLRLVERAPSR